MLDRYIGYQKNESAVSARYSGGRVLEPQRDLPVLAETDVLVTGGGPAGIAAAIAAARQGVRVTLVERYGHLGGLATGGLVLFLDGMWNGRQTVIRGIGEEIADRLYDMGGLDRPEPGKDGTVDAELLKFLALKMVLEAKVDLILHCWGTGAIMEDPLVRGITVQSKSGAQAILSKVVVDASGDGDIFASGGAAFHEAQRGIGLPFRMGNVDWEKAREFRKKNPAQYNDLMVQAKYAGGFTGIGHPAVLDGVIWWNNWGDVRSTIDVRDLTRAEIEAREAISATVKFAKERIPGFEDAFLLETAPQLGVRESRMLEGLYTLTKEDLKREVVFEDSVAQVARGKSGKSFGVPYRCFVPKILDGLLATGRCISVDHYTQEPTRLIPACFATGQAAGVAAALAVKSHIEPRHVDVLALRGQLEQENAYVGESAK